MSLKKNQNFISFVGRGCSFFKNENVVKYFRWSKYFFLILTLKGLDENQSPYALLIIHVPRLVQFVSKTSQTSGNVTVLLPKYIRLKKQGVKFSCLRQDTASERRNALTWKGREAFIAANGSVPIL